MLGKMVVVAVALAFLMVGSASAAYVSAFAQVSQGEIHGNVGADGSTLGIGGAVYGSGTLNYGTAMQLDAGNAVSLYDINVIDGHASGSMANSMVYSDFEKVVESCASTEGCNIEDQVFHYNMAYTSNAFSIDAGRVNSVATVTDGTMGAQFKATDVAGSVGFYAGWNEMTGTISTLDTQYAGFNEIGASGAVVNMEANFLYGYP